MKVNQTVDLEIHLFDIFISFIINCIVIMYMLVYVAHVLDRLDIHEVKISELEIRAIAPKICGP